MDWYPQAMFAAEQVAAGAFLLFNDACFQKGMFWTKTVNVHEYLIFSQYFKYLLIFVNVRYWAYAHVYALRSCRCFVHKYIYIYIYICIHLSLFLSLYMYIHFPLHSAYSLLHVACCVVDIQTMCIIRLRNLYA